MLTDGAVPGDRNVIKRETVEISEYKDFIRELQPMWNVQAK